MEKEKVLRLLIIEDSLNDAEAIASLLRNSGHAIRPVSIEDEEQLIEAVRTQTPELIMCAADSEEPSLSQVGEAVSDNGKDIPVIAVAEECDPELRIRAMQSGALDLVAKDSPDHVRLVVDRELRNLDARRQLRLSEKSMRETEKRCHALLDSSRDAITYVHDGMHIYANPVYLEMFGFDSLEEIEGVPILDMVAPDDHGKFKEFLRTYSKGEEDTQELDVRGLRNGHDVFNAKMEFSPAGIDGEPCTQIIIRDQANNQELEQKLKFLSKQDLLTGLYNRQYFLEELEQEIGSAATGDNTCAVLYIEADNFKGIKENVGIAGSDLVLSDIAGLLREHLDEKAVAARFSDHTFTVLLPDAPSETARSVARNICAAVENHISDVSGTSVTITCSIGVTMIGETSVNAQEILSRADLACEMAQKRGGNAAHLHNPVEDQAASKERDQEWVQMIREALDADRLSLVYQPIASLHGDAGEKYETLVRMNDADGHEVPPSRFIPVAEQSDLIAAVDRWVIGRAIAVLADRRGAGHDTVLFVKVSGKSLADETLLPWISERLKRARLQGDSLVFELSEANAVAHLKDAKAFVAGLRELHCDFCLEHFGNGVNSFQLLKHLPASYLKIDGSLMHNLASNQASQNIVKSITEMAHAKGKITIAEFVEDANSLAVLWQTGVNYIQGHFLQEPNAAMNYDFEGEEA